MESTVSFYIRVKKIVELDCTIKRRSYLICHVHKAIQVCLLILKPSCLSVFVGKWIKNLHRIKQLYWHGFSKISNFISFPSEYSYKILLGYMVYNISHVEHWTFHIFITFQLHVFKFITYLLSFPSSGWSIDGVIFYPTLHTFQ